MHSDWFLSNFTTAALRISSSVLLHNVRFFSPLRLHDGSIDPVKASYVEFSSKTFAQVERSFGVIGSYCA